MWPSACHKVATQEMVAIVLYCLGRLCIYGTHPGLRPAQDQPPAKTSVSLSAQLILDETLDLLSCKVLVVCVRKVCCCCGISVDAQLLTCQY